MVGKYIFIFWYNTNTIMMTETLSEDIVQDGKVDGRKTVHRFAIDVGRYMPKIRTKVILSYNY